jgi:hypothetical protein
MLAYAICTDIGCAAKSFIFTGRAGILDKASVTAGIDAAAFAIVPKAHASHTTVISGCRIAVVTNGVILGHGIAALPCFRVADSRKVTLILCKAFHRVSAFAGTAYAHINLCAEIKIIAGRIVSQIAFFTLTGSGIACRLLALIRRQAFHGIASRAHAGCTGIGLSAEIAVIAVCTISHRHKNGGVAVRTAGHAGFVGLLLTCGITCAVYAAPVRQQITGTTASGVADIRAGAGKAVFTSLVFIAGQAAVATYGNSCAGADHFVFGLRIGPVTVGNSIAVVIGFRGFVDIAVVLNAVSDDINAVGIAVGSRIHTDILDADQSGIAASAVGTALGQTTPGNVLGA